MRFFFFTNISEQFCKKESCNHKSSVNQGSTDKKLPCCVCKETKEARDLCIAKNGLDKCKEFVEAHNRCLRNEGFTVEDPKT
ncbi:Cytochrome c oxidase copper chaperone [Theileria orientalis]|uniref:Cytochrome c oxidase copper chaperone n=1 Tax=Theileria orientalis TaxID=68886 RepID=A0A976SIS4_THEOR|nr:Cytochrome c oxidase copper chaperone [Theileria orientalis]